jgi:hypothetical protein
MSKEVVVIAVLLGMGCQHAGEGASDGAAGAGFGFNPGTGGTGPVSGGATGGGAPAGGGAGAGMIPPPSDAAADSSSFSVDAGACPFSMTGTACAQPGASCSFNSDCVARRCDCVAGNWTCSERQMPCGGTCPTPQTAQCGAPCTGDISGCLCHCGGGGPNYAGCSCTAGRWACGCGH